MADAPDSGVIWVDQIGSKKYYEFAALYLEDYINTSVSMILDYYAQKNEGWLPDKSKIPLIVDVGCGSGQITGPLSEYCDQMIGVDISPFQLNEARDKTSKPNITYIEGKAEALSEVCPKNGVDLITAGMAVQYFDNVEFYKEVKKCLKPNGILVLVGYWYKGIEHTQNYFQNFFSNVSKNNYISEEIENEISYLIEAYHNLKHVPKEITYEERVMPIKMSRREVKYHWHGYQHLYQNGARFVKDMYKKLPKVETFTLLLSIFSVRYQIKDKKASQSNQ